jgi:peroxiredoxin
MITKNKKTKNVTIAAGSKAKDFVIGMKESVIYKLSDFKDKYNVVLVFLDTSPMSNKIKNMPDVGNIKSFLHQNDDVLWFNVSRDDSRHFVIEEKTKKINLLYKTLQSNVPDFYDLKKFPSIFIIDKNGIVHLIYSGYSPTIANDILNALKVITQ